MLARRLLLILLVCALVRPGYAWDNGAAAGGASISGNPGEVALVDGTGTGLEPGGLTLTDAVGAFRFNEDGANPTWELTVTDGDDDVEMMNVRRGRFELQLNGASRFFNVEDTDDALDVLRYDTDEGSWLKSDYEFHSLFMRATEPTAQTNPVKFGWVSPDATLYGLELVGAGGSRPYSVGLHTEGAIRVWWNYLGSNYVTGPHRFTGPLAPTLRLGITTQAVANVSSVFFAIADSDYTLPAVNTALYQGDGDGAAASREYTIVRGNTTNPVAVVAAGTDKIHVQGSEVSGGAVTLTWIADAASIDLTEKGAGVRCRESYRRVSSGPDVFQAAWFCDSIGLGIEVSP